MNEHSLPEDLARWPENAYELLGVGYGVQLRDLKRAYLRLIRLFKAETHPEHFRRIRESYENVLRMIEFSGRAIHLDNADSSATTDSAPANEPFAALPQRIDDADRFWKQAIRGEEAAAYHGLRDLHVAQPNRMEYCLRLYWLLTLDPDLDSARQPCDWLAAALQSSGLRGPALELYRREIEANPKEAIQPRFEKLLAGGGPQNLLADLYSWRWTALRTWFGWDVLEADFPIARERVLGLDESHWLRVLAVAADAAMWIEKDDPRRAVWGEIQKEVKQLGYLGARHGYWFDQHDFLFAVRKDWHPALRNLGLPCALLELVREAWNAPLAHYRRHFDWLLKQIVENRMLCLRQLTQMRSAYPAVMAAFGMIVERTAPQLGGQMTRPAPEAIDALARRFIGSIKDYGHHFRTRVAEFCCRECIEPIWMIEAVHEGRIGWYNRLSPKPFLALADDWPLRYLCLANRLFWA